MLIPREPFATGGLMLVDPNEGVRTYTDCVVIPALTRVSYVIVNSISSVPSASRTSAEGILLESLLMLGLSTEY